MATQLQQGRKALQISLPAYARSLLHFNVFITVFFIRMYLPIPNVSLLASSLIMHELNQSRNVKVQIYKGPPTHATPLPSPTKFSPR